MRYLTMVSVVAVGMSLGASAAAQRGPDPDLIQLGQSLLPQEDPSGAADAGVEASADASAEASSLAAEDGGGGAEDAGAGADDGGAPGDAAASPDSEAPTSAPVALGPAARQARIDSGQNLPLNGPAESPLAKMGVPPAAVPAVATVATVGAMAFWPFLMKTLTGLLKSIAGSFLKTRAKKNQKIDKTQKAIPVMGFLVRPAELGALLIGALIYGLGVCYAFQGRSMKASFLLSQEALVIVIYYSRSAVRWLYERTFKLTTQYKFWPGGGLLCLASAYLGNTLGTVGYELEETTSPDDAKRIVKMKAWLIAISLGMALVFFAANVVNPTKILQSGRIMMSGMALAEILPISPMPGLKIYKWKPAIWGLLVVLVVPTFVLINFVL